MIIYSKNYTVQRVSFEIRILKYESHDSIHYTQSTLWKIWFFINFLQDQPLQYMEAAHFLTNKSKDANILDKLPIEAIWKLYKSLFYPQVESWNPDFLQIKLILEKKM